MKKILTMLMGLMVAGMTGCTGATVTVFCMLPFGPIQFDTTADQLGGYQDTSPTYTLRLKSGTELEVPKEACIVSKAPPPAKKAE